MNLSDAELALIGTIVGSVGLEILRRILDRKNVHAAQSQEIRDELRNQVLDLRDQLAKAKEVEQRLEDEVDEWRTKYLDKRDEDIKNQTQLLIAQSRIESLQLEVDTCKGRLIELERKFLESTGNTV